MEEKRTLGAYVESGASVSGIKFSGNFGGQDGDLRDYTFVDGGVLDETDIADVRLTNGVYRDRQQFKVKVASHLGDWAHVRIIPIFR